MNYVCVEGFYAVVRLVCIDMEHLGGGHLRGLGLCIEYVFLAGECCALGEVLVVQVFHLVSIVSRLVFVRCVG